jgi:hypothetical protein
MTRSKEFEELLDDILQFANKKDEEAIHTHYLKIMGKAHNIGFVPDRLGYRPDSARTIDIEEAVMQKDIQQVYMGDRDPKNDFASQYHADLCERLSEISETGNSSTPYNGKLICMDDGNGMETIFSFKNSDGKYDSLSAIFIMLILFKGYKGVKKCKGCNGFFMLKRKIDQRTCSNRCRQKVYQDSLSPEKQKAARLRRSELYRLKKTGGN